MKKKWWKVTFVGLIDAETEEEAMKKMEENKYQLQCSEIKFGLNSKMV